MLKPYKITIFFLSITLLLSCSSLKNYYSDNFFALDTIITLKLDCANEKEFSKIREYLKNKIASLENLLSTYKNQSEIFRINLNAGKKKIVVSPLTFKLLKLSKEYSRKTYGYFDPTYYTVGRFWDFKNKIKPDSITIKTKLQYVDWEKIELNENNHKVYLPNKDTKIDLGGISKGYIIDQCVLDLKNKFNIKSGILSAGGDLFLIGKKNNGHDWNVGIQDPRNRNKVYDTISYSDKAIATSGDYERYFMIDSVRYCHILNPKTGYPPRNYQSVTVVSENVCKSDAIATAVFAAPIELRKKILENFPDIKLYFITP